MPDGYAAATGDYFPVYTVVINVDLAVTTLCV